MSEEATQYNPVENLEEGVQRRYIIGFDTRGQEVKSPLIVAHESRDTIPPKLNHQTLATLGLGRPEGRKGGFCKRVGDDLVWIDEGPTLIAPANEDEFRQALEKGIQIVEPPK